MELTLRGSKMAALVENVHTNLGAELGMCGKAVTMTSTCHAPVVPVDIEHMSLASVWREFI
jgi:hypothetical protein